MTLKASNSPQDVFIVGCGYIGMRVAKQELEKGRRVSTLARRPEAARQLEEMGLTPRLGDLDRPQSLGSLPLGGHRLYYFAPPPPQGQTDPRLEGLLAAVPKQAPPERIVLISTTGVYGDCAGRWIDEQQPPNPQTDRARRRLAAEQTLRAWSEGNGAPIVILRVAGIYGPGKLPAARLHKGSPVLREEQSPWSNRIHADDLVEACLAAAERGRPGAVYNVADGNPSTMTDYFNRAADALNLSRSGPDRQGASRAGAGAGHAVLSGRIQTVEKRTHAKGTGRKPALLQSG